MSKIGPPQLRAKLYMSALCGKIYNKRMRNMRALFQKDGGIVSTLLLIYLMLHLNYEIC
ncbi:transposase, IS110 family [Klebsiella quasipneumoniae]|nr:transposase, IS110 family [Klebsiella quasipneumoniae]